MWRCNMDMALQNHYVLLVITTVSSRHSCYMELLSRRQTGPIEVTCIWIALIRLSGAVEGAQSSIGATIHG